MPRVKRGTVRVAKRRKLLKAAKGFYLNKSKLYRSAKESVAQARVTTPSPPPPQEAGLPPVVWCRAINAAARDNNGLTTAADQRPQGRTIALTARAWQNLP